MHHVLLLGAGKIGQAVANFLHDTGEYDVIVGDQDPRALARLRVDAHLRTLQVNVNDPGQLLEAMKDRQSVLSAVSFASNPIIAKAALESKCSYFDLTEDVETTKRIRELSNHARPGQIFMPQCGLAPGFVSIAAEHVARQFNSLEEVRMRVGALPIFPTNEMKYNLTWSTDGLINEYGNPCECIHDGKLINTLPLEGLEHFSLDGIDYEAFNTSGGVGTLAETLAGHVRTLNYKTIRYSGHRDLMVFLMNELRLNDRRELLKDILENAVPVTPQDVVLIFITVTGKQNGQFVQITDARKIYHGEFRKQKCSAIQITTAASLCAVLDLHVGGKLPTQGFVKQEDVKLPDFLQNRFGKCYDVKMQNHSPLV